MTSPEKTRLSRRQLLGTAAGVAVAGSAAISDAARPVRRRKRGPVVTNGRINQSVVQWCFAEHWSVEETIKIAKQLGCGSVELISPEHFPLLKKYGMECAIGTIDLNPDPPFVKGMNNPKYQEKVFKATKDAIDACAEYGWKNVISFTGMREGIPDDVGAKNCVEAYKKIIGYAEKK